MASNICFIHIKSYQRNRITQMNYLLISINKNRFPIGSIDFDFGSL